MAALRFVFQNVCKHYRNLVIAESARSMPMASTASGIFLKANFTPTTTTWRASHTFLSRLNADYLWKGATSVSNAGRRKGRGKGRARIRDLNRGQVIGFGKKNMLWPGLNSPVLKGKEILRQLELPPDDSREKRLLELRDKMVSKRSFKLHPLERGWCGNRLPGRNLGPPEAIGGSGEHFEGFESRVLEFKTVMHVTRRGKARRLSALVAVGNKNGLVGFALSRSVNGLTAAKSARNKAGQCLRYIERDNTTVLHDFYSEFGAVKVFVHKKAEGYGLVCHRLVKAICQVVGIKDLYCKVEGPTGNYQNLTKAFIIGLMSQKSPQQLANEKGLHLIETRRDCDYFPRLVASPERCRTEEELGSELVDYKVHVMGGRVEEQRKKRQPFYINFPSHLKALRDRAYKRNQRKVKVHLIAKYGKLTSFLRVNEELKAAEETKNAVQEGS